MFKKSFCLVYVNIYIIFRILFLILSHININFLNLKFFKETKFFTKIILIPRQVEIIEKKLFAIATLDSKDKTYIFYNFNFAN